MYEDEDDVLMAFVNEKYLSQSEEGTYYATTLC